jgi:hypothetical protein
MNTQYDPAMDSKNMKEGDILRAGQFFHRRSLAFWSIGQQTIPARPNNTRAAAPNVQPGRNSPTDNADAPMPNTGISRASGVTVAAGWHGTIVSAVELSTVCYPARWIRGPKPCPANKTLEALRILFIYAALEGAAYLPMPRLLPWSGI